MIAWQPLFGSCLRVSYAETLDLPMVEVAELIEWIQDNRRSEWKAAFGKKGDSK
jgi:hypothetical protein